MLNPLVASFTFFLPCLLCVDVLSTFEAGDSASNKTHGAIRVDCFKQLGAGAFGVVFSAVVSAGFGVRDVAVKVSSRLIRGHPDRGFENEVRALRAITHRNVVGFVAEASDKDNNYLLLDLHHGGSLMDFLKPSARGQRLTVLPLGVALWIARELVEAVVAVHKAGFVHMDIKPANILFRSLFPGDGIVLCDFGASQLFPSSLSKFKTYTAGYAGPEVYSDDWQGGFGFDWHSVGWVMYAMLAGQTIVSVYKQSYDRLKEATMAGDLHKVFERPGWAEVPFEITEFIKKLTQPDPRKRPRDAEIAQMINALCQKYPVDWSTCPSKAQDGVLSESSSDGSVFASAEGSSSPLTPTFLSARSSIAFSPPSASAMSARSASTLSASAADSFCTALASSAPTSPAPRDNIRAASSDSGLSTAAATIDTTPAATPAANATAKLKPFKFERKGRLKGWARQAKLKLKLKLKLKRDSG